MHISHEILFLIISNRRSSNDSGKTVNALSHISRSETEKAACSIDLVCLISQIPLKVPGLFMILQDAYNIAGIVTGSTGMVLGITSIVMTVTRDRVRIHIGKPNVAVRNRITQIEYVISNTGFVDVVIGDIYIADRRGNRFSEKLFIEAFGNSGGGNTLQDGFSRYPVPAKSAVHISISCDEGCALWNDGWTIVVVTQCRRRFKRHTATAKRKTQGN